MRKLVLCLVMVVTFALVTACIAGCSQASNGSSNAASTSASSSDEIPRDQIHDIVNKSLEQTFNNVTFESKVTTVVTATENEQTVNKSTQVIMKGEVDKANKKIHIAYESANSEQLDRVRYNMYIGNGKIVIHQDDQMFPQDLPDDQYANYESSVVPALSVEEIDQMLDVARSARVETHDDGSTTIVITVDPDRLSETEMVDTSSLPESTHISTLVANYTYDSQYRLTEVRYMSNTAGSPTYRVSQSYSLSNYDSTEMPEWPDYQAYMLEQAGIKTDESGRMYFVAEDGNTYYVESIDEDGTVHFIIPGA